MEASGIATGRNSDKQRSFYTVLAPHVLEVYGHFQFDEKDDK